MNVLLMARGNCESAMHESCSDVDCSRIEVSQLIQRPVLGASGDMQRPAWFPGGNYTNDSQICGRVPQLDGVDHSDSVTVLNVQGGMALVSRCADSGRVVSCLNDPGRLYLKRPCPILVGPMSLLT